jgi:hypothetical protein
LAYNRITLLLYSYVVKWATFSLVFDVSQDAFYGEKLAKQKNLTFREKTDSRASDLASSCRKGPRGFWARPDGQSAPTVILEMTYFFRVRTRTTVCKPAMMACKITTIWPDHEDVYSPAIIIFYVDYESPGKAVSGNSAMIASARSLRHQRASLVSNLRIGSWTPSMISRTCSAFARAREFSFIYLLRMKFLDIHFVARARRARAAFFLKIARSAFVNVPFRTLDINADIFDRCFRRGASLC